MDNAAKQQDKKETQDDQVAPARITRYTMHSFQQLQMLLSMQPVAVSDKKGLDFFPQSQENPMKTGGGYKKGTHIAILNKGGIMLDDFKRFYR
jgi:hypothetical protein